MTWPRRAPDNPAHRPSGSRSRAAAERAEFGNFSPISEPCARAARCSSDVRPPPGNPAFPTWGFALRYSAHKIVGAHAPRRHSEIGGKLPEMPRGPMANRGIDAPSERADSGFNSGTWPSLCSWAVPVRKRVGYGREKRGGCVPQSNRIALDSCAAGSTRVVR